MSDVQGDSYRPHIPTDKAYIGKVAGTIRGTDKQESLELDRLTNALKVLGIHQNPYDLVSLENLSPEGLKDLIQQSFESIQVQKNKAEVLSAVGSLWDYLSEEDGPQQVELAFVFGGPNPQRAQIAIDLYKSGQAQKILFSGQHASYMKESEVSEAEAYQQLAIAEGVKPEDIIIETQARNTPENAANSAQLMDSTSYHPKTIMAITLPYHMRRSYLTLKAATESWSPTILRKVAPSAKFTKDNYYLDQNGWSYIFNEYIKLYGARLMRHF